MFSDIQDLNISPSPENTNFISIPDCRISKPPYSSCLYINEGIKKKLRNLIRQYPKGLWCKDLPKAYVKNYNYVLDYREFGCTSIINFLSQIPDVIRCERPGQGDWLLFDATVPKSLIDISSLDLSENINYNPNLVTALDTNKRNKKISVFSNEVVSPGDSWIEIDLNDQLVKDCKFEIDVGEVWSPFKFFIHLKKFSHYLDKFMSDLQDFYNANYEKYKMPDEAIKPKQICVAYYSPSKLTMREEWHRAEILNVLGEKSVSVYMVDFGTVATLKKTHLRFLHKGFLGFPVQAIPAKLVGIAPLNNRESWSSTACSKFLQLVRKPMLQAKVLSVDSNFTIKVFDANYSPVLNHEFLNMLNVVVYDTSDPNRRSLNELLVDENLAIFTKDVVFNKDCFFKKVQQELKQEQQVQLPLNYAALEKKDIHDEFKQKYDRNQEMSNYSKDYPSNFEVPVSQDTDIKESKTTYVLRAGECYKNDDPDEKTICSGNTLSDYISEELQNVTIAENEKNVGKCNSISFSSHPSNIIIHSSDDQRTKQSSLSRVQRKTPPGLKEPVPSNTNLPLLYSILLEEEVFRRKKFLEALELLSNNQYFLDISSQKLALQMINFEDFQNILSVTSNSMIPLVDPLVLENKISYLDRHKISLEKVTSTVSDISHSSTSKFSSTFQNLDSMSDAKEKEKFFTST